MVDSDQLGTRKQRLVLVYAGKALVQVVVSHAIGVIDDPLMVVVVAALGVLRVSDIFVLDALVALLGAVVAAVELVLETVVELVLRHRTEETAMTFEVPVAECVLALLNVVFLERPLVEVAHVSKLN